jgi:hypothetical protein
MASSPESWIVPPFTTVDDGSGAKTAAWLDNQDINVLMVRDASVVRSQQRTGVGLQRVLDAFNGSDNYIAHFMPVPLFDGCFRLIQGTRNCRLRCFYISFRVSVIPRRIETPMSFSLCPPAKAYSD